MQSRELTPSDTLTRSQRKPVMDHWLPTVNPSFNIDFEEININKHIVSNEFEDMVYWHSTSVCNHEHMLSVIETSHFMSLDVAPEPHFPRDF
jgi:hypothetical protein